ncbi:agmatinase [Methanimicrococcus blatticola]|uniref:Agmatinase n=1 Tax=Methanimicrococcus blatticola TaxID=91560 RepID=A0A484F4M8_9EURY|nr:agmatinase [Methanimicrococcus blatticola]MBZ3935346.1 agmatinase [Methanimicrococcus blatticola]MCC2508556.1 agmatinase [Methanimicrococcus blatticola]TDQ67862.1 agmatinase [Methanimicrococcus blatticola]
MFVPTTFFDAIYDYEDAEYVIFGAPFDNTSSFRTGSRWAPDKMREMAINFETYSPKYDLDMTDILVHDAGNAFVSVNIDETLEWIYEDAKQIVDDGKFPIMLGGEHSLTYAPVKACYDACDEKDDFAVLVLDAHFDLRTDFRGLKNNHACVSRHILEDITKKYVSIGIRSGPREEWEYAAEEGIKFYSNEDVFEMGIKEIIKETMEYLNSDHIYLSLDMDALDPAFCPGLGTPEPFGMTDREVREVLRAFAPKTIGFDIVEIAPEYDNGQSAILATKLMREFIFAREASKKLS